MSQLNIQDVSEYKQQVNTKQFDFGRLKCCYRNTNRMRFLNQSFENVQVSNYLAKKEGEKIIKVTQIYYQNKVITLQDIYSLENLQDRDRSIIAQFLTHPSKQSENQEQMDQQRQSQLSSSEFQIKDRQPTKNLMPKKYSSPNNKINGKNKLNFKRDTKNIPRNIVRAFIKDLQNKNSCLAKDVQTNSQEIGFNNLLVINVINTRKLRQKFKSFLQKTAKDWLEKAKIKDKQSHLQAFQIYLKMIERAQKQQQQIFKAQNSVNKLRKAEMSNKQSEINEQILDVKEQAELYK